MNILLEQIHAALNFFYKPFEKFVPIETFRYGVTGSLNTALDIFLYFIAYNFIFEKENADFFFITISPHIAAFIVSFCVTFFTGFLLHRTITFTGSGIQKRVQLFRYLVVVAICILLNYIFLKFFVELCGFYPTPSKALTTVIVVIFSYFSQKNYTFKEAHE